MNVRLTLQAERDHRPEIFPLISRAVITVGRDPARAGRGGTANIYKEVAGHSGVRPQRGD